MKTCLVVDDSSVIRKVARRILEGLAFEITEAEDGQQALDCCRRELPDAVLLDRNMPVMDGSEFLKALRRLPGGDKPKVVFCTTENDVVHIARALHGGEGQGRDVQPVRGATRAADPAAGQVLHAGRRSVAD